MRDAPNLRAVALRARLEAELARLARRIGLNPAAVPDVAARAVEEHAFTLAIDGRLLPSADSLDDWAARVLTQAPFYRERAESPSPIAPPKPDYSKMSASQRLDVANELINRERGR